MDYKTKSYQKLTNSRINRFMIQDLRLKLFREIDIQPRNSSDYYSPEQIKDLMETIELYATTILALLKENEEIYIETFMESRQGLVTNVRNLLLPFESQNFRWDMFYLSYLDRFLNDLDLLNRNKLIYYQRIYDIIIKDLTYGDQYDYLHIVSCDSDSDSD